MSFVLELEGGPATPMGFWTSTVAAHIKYTNRPDLALVVSQMDCTATAVYTKNQVVAAPVIVNRETLSGNNTRIRAIVANAGNANACTGQPGLDNARAMQQIATSSLGCASNQVLLLSTGVIGVQLPMEEVRAGIEMATTQLQRKKTEGTNDGGVDAARAIMTTDTIPKHLAVKVELPDGRVTIGGMAKGAGMIHPNMA
ncbi:MAG: bifunctional ornithine acetyltransferase/N-acetylglutamate synthase, partial [Chloroflexi bacterium]|nr:bifunctional ornithine acetyltransferase/N-acetylglutamate synthase [Chloroflexota bacterium]